MVETATKKARNIAEFADDCARLAFTAETEEDCSLVILLSMAAWMEELKMEKVALEAAGA